MFDDDEGGDMKLLTKEIIRKFPAIHATEEKDPSEVQIIAKFFCPWNQWTWFATEMELVQDEKDDGTPIEEDYLFFGYVVGHEKELGYFVLSDLLSVTGPWGLTIERDRHFQGTLAEVMSGKKS
jgi:hypothetical protein